MITVEFRGRCYSLALNAAAAGSHLCRAEFRTPLARNRSGWPSVLLATSNLPLDDMHLDGVDLLGRGGFVSAHEEDAVLGLDGAQVRQQRLAGGTRGGQRGADRRQDGAHCRLLRVVLLQCHEMIRHHEAQRVHLPLANPRHLLLRRLERVSACCRLGQNQVILRIRLFEVPARGVRLLLRGGAALARLGLAPLGCAVVVALVLGGLLAANGTLQQLGGDGGVALGDLLAQHQARVRRSQPHHRLERTRGDGQRGAGALRAQLGVHVGDDLRRLLGELRRVALLGPRDHLAQECGRQQRGATASAVQQRVVRSVGGLLAILLVVLDGRHRRTADALAAETVHSQHVLADSRVQLGVHLVQQDKEQVEARQQRVGQAHILHHGTVCVIGAVHRVGRCHHRAARVERGVDARLGDCDRLLLHRLVNCHAVQVAHLVELVDAANAAVRQHKRTRLQHCLLGVGVLADVRREANSARAAARGIDPARRNLVYVRQQLRLGRAWVAHEQHVDLAAPPPAAAPREVLVCAAEELAQDALLDVVQAEHRGRHRARQRLVDIALGCQRAHVGLVLAQVGTRAV
mmetsp:Transcript_2185/g.6453  ORF Transcript_2185/g.6453 Transcript_2185/m.6453 type:complete len:575 (+) Transcript_2185:7-1731(+)